MRSRERADAREPVRARVSALVGALGLVVGCYQSSHPSLVDATVVIDAGPAPSDAAWGPSRPCACPCTDPSAACRGSAGPLRMTTPGGATAHRSTRTPLRVTYTSERAYPELYRRALEDWQADCPGTLPVESFEVSEERPPSGCETGLHFEATTPDRMGYVMITDLSGRILGAGITLAAEPSYRQILYATGWALGFTDMPEGSGSVMEGQPDGPRALTQLDREGFCAMYADGGYCRD